MMKYLIVHASHRRAVAEAVLLMIVMRLALVVSAVPSGSDMLLAGDVSIGLLCALWAAVRLRIPRGTWQRHALWESPPVVVVSVVLTGVLGVFALGAAYWGAPAIAPLSLLGWWDALVLVVALVALHAGAYLAARLVVRVWIWWNDLRRTRYLWSLTHTILLAALLAASPFVVVLANVLLASAATQSGSVLGVLVTTLPVVLVLAALTIVGLLAVLPAALIIAFFSARRLTRRLDTLTHATHALRTKQYDTRIGVAGVDEVAQLQQNFNAMAGDLQHAIGAVQAERDAVQTLLDQRRQLIANVSHELRTPVATLRGYLDSTLEHWNGTPPASLPHDLQVMQRETVRLQTLIDDLFTLAHAEASTLEFRPQRTDINQLVQRCVEAVAPQAWHTSKVEVVATLAPQQAHAHVDAARTEQILFNLLHNAIRHTSPGGIIAANVELETSMVVVAVRDTGEGIAPDALPHIWERFYRAPNAHGSGAGLGLALVKELAETMGGTVAADSMVGEGSCFTVRLPRALASTG
jgi:signal transduction histidine kinase